MAVIQISSREFRDKQKSMFDLADQGEKIIIKRGTKPSYLLVAISDDDLYFTPEMLRKIDESIQEAREGKLLEMYPGESLSDFLARTE